MKRNEERSPASSHPYEGKKLLEAKAMATIAAPKANPRALDLRKSRSQERTPDFATWNLRSKKKRWREAGSWETAQSSQSALQQIRSWRQKLPVADCAQVAERWLIPRRT